MATVKNDSLEAHAYRMFGIATVPNPFGYLALSENTSAEVATGTTLTGEITTGGLERAAATITYVSSYIAQMVHTWTATADFNVRKIAAFSEASGGRMHFEHLTATVKGVDIGESITGTVQTLYSDES